MNSKKKERMVYLDFARVVATVLIVIYHFNIQIGLHAIQAPIVFIQTFSTENIGSIGISLFILISGASLMKNYSQDPFSVQTFYKKRISSIAIIYYLTYISTWLVLFWISGRPPYNGNPNLWTFLLTILGMDGFLYYRIPNYYLCGEWFLGLIIIFYVLFPMLRKCVNSSFCMKIFGILLVIYILLTQVYDKIFVMDIIRNPIIRLPEFYAGMCVGKYVNDNHAKNIWKAIGACMGMAFLFGVNIGLMHIYIAFLGGILCLYVLIEISKYCKGVKKRVVLKELSKISFAIILVHHNIIGSMLGKFNGRVLTTIEVYSLFFCCLCITIIAAMLMYQMSEKIKLFLKKDKMIGTIE